VENPSRMSHRRIYETVGIRYCDVRKMEPIIEQVKTMLTAHPEIDETQTLIVNFNQFAPSSLDFFIYTFTHTTNWIKFHEVKQDVLLKVIGIIEQNGAEVAFPTSTIHMPDKLQLEGLDAAVGTATGK
jgi:MscS family membrane protein